MVCPQLLAGAFRGFAAMISGGPLKLVVCLQLLAGAFRGYAARISERDPLKLVVCPQFLASAFQGMPLGLVGGTLP
jgi:hypothetical protein